MSTSRPAWTHWLLSGVYTRRVYSYLTYVLTFCSWNCFSGCVHLVANAEMSTENRLVLVKPLKKSGEISARGHGVELIRDTLSLLWENDFFSKGTTPASSSPCAALSLKCLCSYISMTAKAPPKDILVVLMAYAAVHIISQVGAASYPYTLRGC